jgi:transposase-like protein
MNGFLADARALKGLLAEVRSACPGQVRPRYPRDLKRKIVQATETHGIRPISGALGFSRNTLKNWIREFSASAQKVPEVKTETVVEGVEFIELAQIRTPTNARMEVILPSGIMLRVGPEMPPVFIARLCRALGGNA